MFNKEILVEDERLRAICSYDSKGKKRIDAYYGIGYWYKKYAGFPEKLPLCLHIDHSPSIQETLLPFDIGSPFRSALFHNTLKITDNKEKKRFKKTYIGGSAFVHYRKMFNIERNKNPTGTVCFPLHPTAVVDVIMDYDAYMDDLLKLPKKYHPFTICLYYLDIENGLQNKFLKRGFKVVTAGHMMDKNFTKRFYDIIKDKKFATANVNGSFLYYVVEMGIPFFYFGKTDSIKLINHGDKSAKMDESSFDEYANTGRIVSNLKVSENLFDEPLEYVTKEQQDHANFILGTNKAIRPSELKSILWREYLYFYFVTLRKKQIRIIISMVKQKMNKLNLIKNKKNAIRY